MNKQYIIKILLLIILIFFIWFSFFEQNNNKLENSDIFYYATISNFSYRVEVKFNYPSFWELQKIYSSSSILKFLINHKTKNGYHTDESFRILIFDTNPRVSNLYENMYPKTTEDLIVNGRRAVMINYNNTFSAYVYLNENKAVYLLMENWNDYNIDKEIFIKILNSIETREIKGSELMGLYENKYFQQDNKG